MVELYFSKTMSPAEYRRLEIILTSPNGVADFTPAEVFVIMTMIYFYLIIFISRMKVEQLCAEYDEIEDFLGALEEKVLENTSKLTPTLKAQSSTQSGASNDATSLLGMPSLRRGLSTTRKSSQFDSSNGLSSGATSKFAT